MLGSPVQRKGRASALFCLLLLLAICFPALAQKHPKVGVILAGSPPNKFGEAFARGLAEHGWIDGKNVEVRYQYARGRPEQYQELISQLIAMKVDVIVAGGGTGVQRLAIQATRTIPIVLPASGDPVRYGFVESLGKPGGNVTGLSNMAPDFDAKRVQLLRDAFPKVRQISILHDGNTHVLVRTSAEDAAAKLGLRFRTITVSRPDELETAVQAAAEGRPDAMVVVTSPLFTAHRKRLVELIGTHGLIAIYDNREFVEAGGLMSYGPDVADLYRSSARFVDRILRGAKAGDLPIQQASKFELVVNARAARNARLPSALMVRADDVIE